MEGLAEITPFVQLGASGVLLGAIFWFGRYFIRLVSSGDWVPKRELDYNRQVFDARLADKEAQIARALTVAAEWRAAHETSERTRELLNQQNRDLVDALRAQVRFFDAFRDAVERDEPDDSAET